MNDGVKYKKKWIGLGLLFILSRLGWATELPNINQTRLMNHLQKLSEFGKNPQGGVSRIAYSKSDVQGREYVMTLMFEAGLDVSIDYAGNLIGKREGSKENLKPIVMGSHIDTVPEGGNYDGIVGSLSAIEVVRTLKENNITTKHPLEIIIFQNEEGGHMGSRAITSGLSEQDLNLISQSKKTIREGIKYIGGKPDRLSQVKRSSGDIAGCLELHIEQGSTLEKEKKNIGIVEGVVGIRRWNVTFEGFANHAGTTPMLMRQDALLAAAKFIEQVHEIVTNMSGKQVATVGKVDVTPNAPNVIPGQVRLTVETRDLDSKKLDTISNRFFSEAEKIAKTTNTKVSFEQTYNTPPVPTSPEIRSIIQDSAKELGFSIMSMPSGAGHDAQEMAKLGPMGMIFIPSAKGISHSPQEFSTQDDIDHGANVLLHALMELDSM